MQEPSGCVGRLKYDKRLLTIKTRAVFDKLSVYNYYYDEIYLQMLTFVDLSVYL